MRDEILHKLTERVKELTALHGAARILQQETKSASEIAGEIVILLPPAWQYPEITCARIRFMEIEAVTSNFKETPWKQAASFCTHSGYEGTIEVFYTKESPEENEGPFLKEERDLIESLAEMLRSYFERFLSDKALKAAHDSLEQEVIVRTADLQKANEALQTQVSEYRIAQNKIDAYQIQLRQLASELSLTEARERRAIAADLHDHIGQALAFVKMNISVFRGNAIFCGFETNINEITTLLDQTIRYIRDMTFEISPPVLYELGLEAALEWLADKYQNKHGLNIKVSKTGHLGLLPDDLKVTLFKSVQELLTNAVKHSGANEININICGKAGQVEIAVEDNGHGFDVGILEYGPLQKDKFGLFNIRERLSYLGGNFEIDSLPGKGTKISLITPRKLRG
jgi:signal transduction histidine kinase